MLFLYYYIYLIFLQHFLMFIIEFWAFTFYIKTAKDCFFLCQPICVYATITASMCFEIDSGNVQKYHTQLWILQYLNKIKGKCSHSGWQLSDVYEHVLHRQSQRNSEDCRFHHSGHVTLTFDNFSKLHKWIGID